MREQGIRNALTTQFLEENENPVRNASCRGLGYFCRLDGAPSACSRFCVESTAIRDSVFGPKPNMQYLSRCWTLRIVNKTEGTARVFSRDDAPLGRNVVKAEHNLNPPGSNPSLTINQSIPEPLLLRHCERQVQNYTR